LTLPSVFQHIWHGVLLSGLPLNSQGFLIVIVVSIFVSTSQQTFGLARSSFVGHEGLSVLLRTLEAYIEVVTALNLQHLQVQLTYRILLQHSSGDLETMIPIKLIQAVTASQSAICVNSTSELDIREDALARLASQNVQCSTDEDCLL
jgi:hypothetical protein